MLRLVAVMAQESELLPRCWPIGPIHARRFAVEWLINSHIQVCSIRRKSFLDRVFLAVTFPPSRFTGKSLALLDLCLLPLLSLPVPRNPDTDFVKELQRKKHD